MEIMNEEKMYPKGKGVDDSWDSWRDGTHRKTNKYIDPSKQVCVSPSTRRRGSVKARELGETRKNRTASMTHLCGRYPRPVPTV
jgi:hypothetical protein